MLGLSWVVAVVACGSSAPDTTPPPPPPCIDHPASGWLGCAGSGHAQCCSSYDKYCFAKDIDHGCVDSSHIFGPAITCDCGWADCNGDTSDGCETDLSSNANCGACGVRSSACSASGPPGKPELLFPSQYQPQGLAIDDENIYWMSDGVLSTAPKGGGSITVLATGESSWNATMAVSNGHVYWPWITGQIHRIATSGGAVEVLAAGIGMIVSNLVVYADTAFVIVSRGTAGEIVDSLGHDLAPTSGPGSLALQNDTLYFSDEQGLHSMHVDGTSLVNIAPVTGLVAASGSNVFVASYSAITTFDGTTTHTTPLTATVNVRMPVATDSQLYVAGSANVPPSQAVLFESPSIFFIGSIDPATGETTALASRPRTSGIYAGFLFGADNTSQLAVDDAYVYYATFGTDCAPGNVYRIAR